MEVEIQQEVECNVPLDDLRDWTRRLVATLAPRADSLTIRWIRDEEMATLNSRYRGMDRTTDVLSFPGEESFDGYHLGDIAISVEQAARQAGCRARQDGVDIAETAQDELLLRELRILSLHGILHCLGHDHEADDGEMEALETALRSEWIEGAKSCLGEGAGS